ncbi:NFACT family protein [uncultured Acetatifactor sp.]|jgi:predicted ribosome quality control (RQC) complex YloA/Tae2 family protein|uniref:Rqc2 family fibronectin-binding protein n=1 Tax=uncultured Acetatifactor sp. TaxID=1671927 RepID=UPI0026175397|nr:NFACT RNA binding domain-containing protein [uncultured Acetatifactor sp.]
MAFDGVTIANVVSELKRELTGGRLYKIAQPEADELLLTIKQPDGTKKLLISAQASLPLLYLTGESKPSPMTAPGFCMLLRKHLQNGRITGISQPGLERIVHIDVEHLDEMGDLRRKTLVVEIMGKHSNIIFCDSEGTIIDSIKHVSAAVSSLREVLPGKAYFIAATQDKLDALSTDGEAFRNALSARPQPVFKALYGSFTGISPVLAQELCYEAGIDADLPTAALGDSDYEGLYGAFSRMAEAIRQERFSPNIAYTDGSPVEFCALPLTMYGYGRQDAPSTDSVNPGEKPAGDYTVPYGSMSALLEHYYAEKNVLTHIRQKSADLRRIVQTALERNVKKYDLQLRQMKDTEKRDTYRVYGELLNTYGYSAEPGAKSLQALNYYTDETVTIPLDPTLSAKENAQKYFDRYGKMKRTYEALSQLTVEVRAEIQHLESVSTALDIALYEEDLAQIKEELTESGYIRRKAGNRGKKQKITSRPFHYLSSDGFHMYVGKNNFQNDELTFKLATGNDWWFHAKQIPGSHVVVKTGNAQELPDRTFEEAARLAAYYSKGRGQEKVEIDYVQKKHVKKPNGAKPGFVVYYTNYSMAIDSDISGIQPVNE